MICATFRTVVNVISSNDYTHQKVLELSAGVCTMVEASASFRID